MKMALLFLPWKKLMLLAQKAENAPYTFTIAYFYAIRVPVLISFTQCLLSLWGGMICVYVICVNWWQRCIILKATWNKKCVVLVGEWISYGQGLLFKVLDRKKMQTWQHIFLLCTVHVLQPCTHSLFWEEGCMRTFLCTYHSGKATFKHSYSWEKFPHPWQIWL